MKRILIPTDFSVNAYNALRYGIRLFNDAPRTFILLNTHLRMGLNSDNGLAYPVSVTTDNHDEESSQRGLEETISKIMEEFPDSAHNYEALSSTSLLVDEIKNQIATKYIDLIIMGTQGATGSRELFFGSITQRVVKKVDTCPILVIPNEIDYKPWSNIGFATNFELPYEQWQIAPLTKLAAHKDSTIQVVQVSDSADLSDAQFKKLKALHVLFGKMHYEHNVAGKLDTIEKSLLTFIEELKIEVLALIKYKHGFLESFMREPVVKKITFHTGIPLLVLPENKSNLPKTTS